MKFATGVSDSVRLVQAVTDAAGQVLRQLNGARCHVVFVFVSPIYRTHWAEAMTTLHHALKPSVVIGCSGSGVIGQDQELEWVPAISLVAASLPEVRLLPFSVSPAELELSSPGGFWIDKVGVAPDQRPICVLLADPYTCEPSKLLSELNATFPGAPIIGGLASGGNDAGEHVLLYDTELVREGAVGLAMTGNIQLDTIISQGCRPIGRPYIVTKAEGNVVWELGGRQTLETLREVLMGLSITDQELAQRSIFVGLVINEMKSSFRPGDFLIRNLAGIDPPSGAIAVTESVHIGQTIQFHLRDPNASRDELRRLLTERNGVSAASPPAGGLLFNCLGRGKSFYGSSHHDMKTIRSTFSRHIPVGGFFCNGEIGPVGGVNFLHGYTASLGLFRPREPVAKVTPSLTIQEGCS